MTDDKELEQRAAKLFSAELTRVNMPGPFHDMACPNLTHLAAIRAITTALKGQPASSGWEGQREALIAAYEAAATDVHEHWTAGNQEKEADFGEAARDYADSVLSSPPEPTPPEQALELR